MNDNDLALKVLLDFLNAVEEGIATAKQRIETIKVGWNPEEIQWIETQGNKGPYERSEDMENPQFKALLMDLKTHDGKLRKNGYFYWKFDNSETVGRKRV